MKFVLFTTLFLIITGPSKHKISIEIKGIASEKGNLYVALFRQKDEFPVFGKQYLGKIVPVTSKKMSYAFDNLSEGKYAIAIYHDVNKNGKLDKNYLGIPTEAYGFSNNARRTFSAPSFEEAEINLKTDLGISITLK